ncbi:MAG: hypothetical protein FMNOHCHN_02090 [Ignavibacteriaceae bacterium]|nr:hypothetical protein [Ignavibacteriaceae bacterium]
MTKENKEKLIIAALSVLFTAAVIIWFYDLVRYAIAGWLYSEPEGALQFSGIFLEKMDLKKLSPGSALFVLLLPYLTVIIISELSVWLLRLKKSFRTGAAVIIFNLLNLLFLFVSMFYLMGTVALDISGNELWTAFFKSQGLKPQEQYLYIFLGTALTFFYSTFATTRIKHLLTELF